MQVSDAGMLMRATLQASKILIEYRGMMPLMRSANELDVRPWLARRSAIEELDEELYEEVANTFVAEMLDHQHKQVVLGRIADARARRVSAKKKKKPKKKKSKARAGRKRRTAADEDDDEEEEDEEEEEPDEDDESDDQPQEVLDGGQYVIRMQGETYAIHRLVSDYQQFMPHLYPLVFGCVTPSERRPHPLLDYRLAVIVHTGRDVKTVNATLKSIIVRIDRLRTERSHVFGFDAAHAANMPCRVLVVLWGSSFFPKTGKSYNMIRNGVKQLNVAQREPGGGNITFEAYSVLELQTDIGEHEDVSTYEVVRDPGAVPELRTIKPHQFPYMRDAEPQAKLRDYRPGQVVRITRRDFDMGGITHCYRIVVSDEQLRAASAAGGGGDGGGADEEDE